MRLSLLQTSSQPTRRPRPTAAQPTAHLSPLRACTFRPLGHTRLARRTHCPRTKHQGLPGEAYAARRVYR